jgi:hypothetical protein
MARDLTLTAWTRVDGTWEGTPDPPSGFTGRGRDRWMGISH